MRRLIVVLGFIFITPLLGAGSLAAQTSAQASRPSATDPGLAKLTITLVLGDTQPGASEGLSPAATKALADLKDFLPYKQFRVLDSLPIIGLRSLGVKLRGLNGEPYDFTMNGNPVGSNTIGMTLRVIESATQVRPPRVLIEAQFQMAIGETVVVGTSRLEGTKALILLVTSVP